MDDEKFFRNDENEAMGEEEKDTEYYSEIKQTQDSETRKAETKGTSDNQNQNPESEEYYSEVARPKSTDNQTAETDTSELGIMDEEDEV